MTYNAGLIEKTVLEEQDPAVYYKECCEFLADFIAKRQKLIGTQVQTALTELLQNLKTAPEHRRFERPELTKRLTSGFRLGSTSSAEPAEAFLAALFLFGMVGKSLYFISKRPQSAQFDEEVRRLFEDMNQFRGNLWLFYTAGQLAQSGFGVEFIPESNVRTPDYRATKGSLTVFVEASARSQSHTTIKGLEDILWNLMHGDASSGKQIKFVDPSFDPGLIVVDVSNSDVNANSTGLESQMKLHPGAFVHRNDQGFVYDISRDPEFFAQLHNTGNVVELSVRFFHMMAETGRYAVRALLVGISMGIGQTAGTFNAKRGAIMVVDSRYPQLALQELARGIYLVDTQKPLP